MNKFCNLHCLAENYFSDAEYKKGQITENAFNASRIQTTLRLEPQPHHGAPFSFDKICKLARLRYKAIIR